MIDKNKVLELVKLKGPLIPRDVVRAIGGDTFIIGAVLSQLVDNKEIRITHAKIGGSPFYYFPGQETKLDILYNHLHEKERRAYDLIKQRKIIRDNEADPLLKVILRQIKDFAKALEVNINGEKEIFWKWYLLPNSEAEPIIRDLVSKDIKKQEPHIPKQEEIKKPEPKQEIEEPKQKPKEQQQDLIEEEHTIKETSDDKLLNKIHKLFTEKKIIILEETIIRKNSDFDLIIKIPSEVGKIKYYCKVKNKKKTNDKDLSSLFVDGQMKKLPILYITNGELTKKAQEKLETDFTTISVFKI